MTSQHTLEVSERAKLLYADQLQDELETNHLDKYVAIEPDSGDFFLGASYGESVLAARTAHPDRISFVIRVGHEAALHLGAMTN